MSGFSDTTLGSQRLGFAGGTKLEFHGIDVSNGVDSGFTIPTTLVKLQGWVGQGCFSAGCVTLRGRVVTNMSLCEGPVLEVSIADASDDTLDDANSKFYAIVWGW